MVDKRDKADKLIDELIAGKTPEEIVGEGGLLQQLAKRLYERVLEGEMTHHLGYPPQAPEGRNTGNSRNGKTTKTVKTDRADIPLAIPRDRNGEFEPQIIKMEKKVEAGARFFQTQAIYDIGLFENFLKKIKHLKVPILGGIVLLKSAGMAKYMNKNVAGVFVPDELIKEMEGTKDKVAKSVEIAGRLISRLKPMCQGIHIMPIGWDTVVPKVMDASGL
jgi:hypothetical protein